MASSNAPAAIVDASFVIGLCAMEQDKHSIARSQLNELAANGYELFAPGLLINEVLFVLCNKLRTSAIGQAEYDLAVRSFDALMQSVNSPPNGDTSLIGRAAQIRGAYGCAWTADAIYIALAEQLQSVRAASLVTFDEGMKSHAQANAATVAVDLLPTQKS